MILFSERQINLKTCAVFLPQLSSLFPFAFASCINYVVMKHMFGIEMSAPWAKNKW